MAEHGQTSSMTSVTEEDSSEDSETDTTESSYSNITSSILSSTDTDDKLTPGLINISISKTKGASENQSHLLTPHGVETRVSSRQQDSDLVENLDSDIAMSQHISSMPHTGVLTETSSGQKRRRKNGFLKASYPSKSSKIHTKAVQSLQKRLASNLMKEHMGVTDPDGKLSTDMSDTSSIAVDMKCSNNNAASESGVDVVESDDWLSEEEIRPYHPDMTSGTWYQARCFDRYWSHYNFVMEWYQQHLMAVETLQRQMIGPAFTWQNSTRSKSARKSRRTKRARNRRNAKAREREKKEEEMLLSMAGNSPSGNTNLMGDSAGENSQIGSEKGEKNAEDLEMEITDEMMEFFHTSLKHKMERESAKKATENGAIERLNIQDTRVGHKERQLTAPFEQPGVKRASEIRELYGKEAPMIHGMETALQMTFDRFTDKCQPKMWPNVPLKIVFTS